MNRSRTFGIPALLSGLLILAACTGSDAASSQAPSAADSEPSTAASAAAAEASTAASEAPAGEVVEVTIAGSSFEPDELTIAAGTEVVWVNDDRYAHTVTHGTDGDAVDDPIVDEPIAAGGEVRVVFDEAGSFPITCEIHPSMQMEITVEG